MLNGFTFQEIFLIAVISPIFLASLIALFNFDGLNDFIITFHGWVSEKHSTTKSGVLRFILALFKYPGNLPKEIKHDGWKSGLTLVSTTFSTVLLGGTIAAVGVVTYYVVMAILAILVVIAVIAIIIAILGALGSS